MAFGREKAYAESDWKRRLGYALLGELHIPGRLRVWHIIRELRRLGYWHEQPIALLDAGGGEGAFAYYCARRFPNWQVVVADNEPAAIARGQQIKQRLGLHNLAVRSTDLLEDQGEQLFDVVICSDVLEHIEQDDRVVQNLAQALKPHGVLILTSPSSPQRKHLPLVAWRERRVGFHPSHYGHVRDGYSPKDLDALFRQSGLGNERIRWTFGRFGTLMFDIFFVTGDNKPNIWVYVALFPFYIGLSWLDVCLPNRDGSAIMAVGKKS